MAASVCSESAQTIRATRNGRWCCRGRGVQVNFSSNAIRSPSFKHEVRLSYLDAAYEYIRSVGDALFCRELDWKCVVDSTEHCPATRAPYPLDGRRCLIQLSHAIRSVRKFYSIMPVLGAGHYKNGWGAAHSVMPSIEKGAALCLISTPLSLPVSNALAPPHMIVHSGCPGTMIAATTVHHARGMLPESPLAYQDRKPFSLLSLYFQQPQILHSMSRRVLLESDHRIRYPRSALSWCGNLG